MARIATWQTLPSIVRMNDRLVARTAIAIQFTARGVSMQLLSAGTPLIGKRSADTVLIVVGICFR